MKMRTLALISLLFLISFEVAFPQLQEDKKKQIDSLFLDWNAPDHPGGTVGIMQDGKLIYSEAYGLASLEYMVPNSPGTQFNIASVSKQFTAFGIILLDLQGKLSVDDDIRMHLPELPEFEQSVTIRHMLHHTSGLRSLHSMLQLAGWRDDDLRTNEDLLRFVKLQKDLNFIPGDEYLYCNTGYILMAIIIERITGESFSSWMKEEVFNPLGMYNSYIEDKYNRVVKNNATSYDGRSSTGFVREVDYWGYTGSGNMHSNMTDLLIWLGNIRDPEPDWKKAFEMLQTMDKFNNGEDNNYAFGVTVDEYKGENRIRHSGSIGGFRAYISTYPKQNLDIVVLSNFSSSNPGSKVNSISDIIMSKEVVQNSIQQRPNDRSEEETVELSQKDALELIGVYHSPELLTQYRISHINGELYVYHTRHGEFKISPRGRDEFRGSLSLFRNVIISRDDNGEVNGLFVSNGRVRNLWFEKID